MLHGRWTTGVIGTSLAFITFLAGVAIGNRSPSQPTAQAAATPAHHWQAVLFEAGQSQAAITQGNVFLAGLDPSCQVSPSLAATSSPPTFVFVVAYRC